MSIDAMQLLQDALKLSEGDRADLAAKLIDSLDPSQDDDVEAAWDKEIQLRVEELRTGQVRGIPWPEARRLILEDGDESGPSLAESPPNQVN